MMKIGVLADTHIPVAAPRLPEKVRELFQGVDSILHAGDLVEYGVIEELEKLSVVVAVSGNMDSPEVQHKLPLKRIIEAEKFKIGLIHGWGAPFGLEERVRREFPRKVDVIVFGHSHAPCNHHLGGVLFFNPGSPTDKVFALTNSVGILEIGEKISAKIIRI